MDVFKINWNQKIKDDIFVNKVLNGDKSNDRFTFNEFHLTENKWKPYMFRMSKVSVPEAIKYYQKKKLLIDDWEYEDNTQLFDNTGPHSLYNLRYVSLNSPSLK